MSDRDEVYVTIKVGGLNYKVPAGGEAERQFRALQGVCECERDDAAHDQDCPWLADQHLDRATRWRWSLGAEMADHPWVSVTGRPWSLRVKSDLCARCGITPDAHPTGSPPPQATVEALADVLMDLRMDGPSGDGWTYQMTMRHYAERILSNLRRR